MGALPKMSAAVWVLCLALTVSSLANATRMLLSTSVPLDGTTCNFDAKFPVRCSNPNSCCKKGYLCHPDGRCITEEESAGLCVDGAVCNGGCCPPGHRCTMCGSCHAGPGPADCEKEAYIEKPEGYTPDAGTHQEVPYPDSGEEEPSTDGDDMYKKDNTYNKGETEEKQKYPKVEVDVEEESTDGGADGGSMSVPLDGNTCNFDAMYPVRCSNPNSCCKKGYLCHPDGRCVTKYEAAGLCVDGAVCNGGCCPAGHRCTMCGSCHAGPGPADCEKEAYTEQPKDESSPSDDDDEEVSMDETKEMYDKKYDETYKDKYKGKKDEDKLTKDEEAAKKMEEEEEKEEEIEMEDDAHDDEKKTTYEDGAADEDSKPDGADGKYEKDADKPDDGADDEVMDEEEMDDDMPKDEKDADKMDKDEEADDMVDEEPDMADDEDTDSAGPEDTSQKDLEEDAIIEEEVEEGVKAAEEKDAYYKKP